MLENILKKLKKTLTTIKLYLLKRVFTKKNKNNLIQFFIDIKDCIIKVIFGASLPERKDMFNFFLLQIIVNTCGWTAGLLAGDMVDAYFKTPSAKNLWGIAGKRDGKTMVTKEEFEMYNWWAKYLFGLLILTIVRYLVFNTIEEYKKLKKERGK